MRILNWLLFSLSIVASFWFHQNAGAALANDLNIPVIKFELENGLEVVVQENRSLPVVTVFVAYHVGSKNEKPGKTGSAHLFEHVLFGASEDSIGTISDNHKNMGISILNGYTSNDLTAYFAAGPTSKLDGLLWLEAQRMGHFLGAFNQEKLDAERNIIFNEIRQRRGAPYGNEGQIIANNTYPAGHPYSWDVGGTFEDLGNFTLEETKEWFRRYYGPNNATLVLVGDISAETAKEKAQQYFGAIKPSAPVSRLVASPSAPAKPGRFLNQANVPADRVTMVWNTPPARSPDVVAIDLIAGVLGGGASSRLHKALVEEKQIATSVSAKHTPKELGGQLIVQATASSNATTRTLEEEINVVLKQLLADGVNDDELKPVKASIKTDLMLKLDHPVRLSIVLGESNLIHNDPSHFQEYISRLAGIQLADVNATYMASFSDAPFILETVKAPKVNATGATISGTQLPRSSPKSSNELPSPIELQLSNGLRVVALNKPNTPLFAASLIFEAGAVDDPSGRFGLAEMTVNLLEEGTTRRDAPALNDAMSRLGAQLTTVVDLEYSQLNIRAPLSEFESNFAILNEIVTRPAFSDASIERVKKQQADAINIEIGGRLGGLSRVVHDVLYDESHPYTRPREGLGYKDDIDAITKSDIINFHNAYLTPANATLVLAGDFSGFDVKKKLEASFRSWRSRNNNSWSDRNTPPTEIIESGRIVIIDKPGARQSVLTAVMPLQDMDSRQRAAFDLANSVVAYSPFSRISANLRVQKGWSYGAGSIVRDYAVNEYFEIGALVQTDKTAASMTEIIKELEDFTGSRPITESEFDAEKQNLAATATWNFVAVSNTARELVKAISEGRDPDYATQYISDIQSLTIADVRATAEMSLNPEKVIWVIAGDASQIQDGIRNLGLGDVEIIELQE